MLNTKDCITKDCIVVRGLGREQSTIFFSTRLGWRASFAAMLSHSLVAFAILFATRSIASADDSKPPYHGTIFINGNIMTDKDKSVFERIEPKESAKRRMFDRRVNKFIENEPFLFDAYYEDGLKIEIQVNSEFESADRAAELAEEYAKEFGRLPKCLRTNVRTSWIHDGKQLFGGGNENLLIHIEQTAEYRKQGILEETLIHEATHTSLDPLYARHPDWVRAQQSDRMAISTYAKDHPNREDLAETFLLWFAIRHRRDRLTPEQIETIERSIPARLAFLDSLQLNLSPLVPSNPSDL